MQYVLKCLAGLGFGLCALLCQIPVDAQRNDSLQVKELQRVQVSGGRKKWLSASVTPVQSLWGDALHQLNSFSVADAIRYFSGVQLKDYGGIGGLKTIDVRNMGTHHVAVMVDDLRIVNAQNGTVDLGKYSLDNIEAIQVYKGGNMAAIQPALNQFASSAIYLRTRRPRFANKERQHYRAGIRSGSFGLFNPSILWQQKITNNSSLTSNFEMVSAHGRYRFYEKLGQFDTTAIRQNADITSVRAEASFIKTSNEADELFVKAYYYGSNRGLPGAVVENRYYNPQRLWDKNFFIQGSYKTILGDWYTLHIHTKYAHDYLQYHDPDFITDAGPLTNIYRQNEWYISAAQGLKLADWWQLALATDISRHTMLADLYRFPFPTRHTVVAAFNSSFTWDQLSINTGLLAVHYNNKVKYFQSAEDQSALSPTIGFSWQPFKEIPLRLRSFYKESLRMPSFNDLYYTQIGNNFLKPEYTQQYNAGLTWQYSHPSSGFNISAQADAYLNKVNNKIVAVPAANLFRWMMMNIGLVQIKGIDLVVDVSKNVMSRLLLNAGLGYSWQQALNQTPQQTSYNQQIPYAPKHSGSVHGSATYKQWTFNYSFLYTGERYVLPENTEENYMPSWYTTDIGLQRQVDFHHKKITISAELNNLFNQYYDVVLSFPMPGRSYRISIFLNY